MEEEAKGNKIKGTRQVLVIKYPRRRPVHLEKRLEKTRIAKNKSLKHSPIKKKECLSEECSETRNTKDFR
jgi:hypothetical protein